MKPVTSIAHVPRSPRRGRARRRVPRLVAASLGVAGFLAAETSTAPAVPETSPAVGIAHHEILAWISPDSASITVRDRFRLDEAGGGGADRVRFLLHRNLAVRSVAAGAGPVGVTEQLEFNPKHYWRRPDYASLGDYAHAREIELSLPAGASAPVWITITYAGAIDDTLHPPAEEYGRSFETTTGLVEARGAFLEGSTFWIPTVPDDLFTFELTANVPEGWDAVSQGALAERSAGGGRRIARWSCPDPMEEAYLVAGPYRLQREAHGAVDRMIYMYSLDPDLTRKYLDATARYLDRYSARIGPYPFAKFALVENFWETGYGMPSFTLLGSTVIRLPFIIDTSYGHEILHNWWGNSVYVAPREGNWCEGLTSYLADHAYKEDEGAAAAAEYRRDQLSAYRNYVHGARDIPLAAFTERHSGATQAIGYGKSLMVYHMLRRRMGDERFTAALSDLYATHRFRVTSWSDVIDAFERASGEDLAWYEAQWIRRAGAPVIALGETRSRRGARDGAGAEGGPGSEAWVVDGEILQSEPFFRVDVPVAVETEDGRNVRETVRCDGPSTPFRLEVASRPRSLRVDPDFDVMRWLHREEIPPVLSQTLGADTIAIIVASEGPPEILSAYRELAARWDAEKGVGVFADGEVSVDALASVTTWLFGETTLAGAFSAAGPEGSDLARIGETLTGESAFPPARHSLVATKRHPRDPERSWTWLHLASAGDADAIGRKIPHYGRYSYLFFDGAQNVGKGFWTIEASPLTAVFE